MAMPAGSSPWMHPTTRSFRWAPGSPNSTAVMGRPCTDRPSVSVCTGTGTTARSVGTARAAMGDGDGGEAEGGASRAAAGDGVPPAGGGAPVLAVAVGGAVVARAAGAPALAGRLPPQVGATSALAASARQIGGRTNMMMAPILARFVLASP